MHMPHGVVDGVLLHAGPALQSVERCLQIVVDGIVVEFGEVFTIKFLQVFHLFFI